MNVSRASARGVAVAAGLLLAAAWTPGPSMAAVEFVTTIGTCTKVDTIGDGKDLSLQAGNDMQFEVWGDGIDVNPSVRVTLDDSNAGNVTARILRAHNGAENLGRGCRILKGSVEVEVDSPASTTTTLQRSLRFRMPAGDESRLQTRVVPFRTPVWTYTGSGLTQSPQSCLTRDIGTVAVDLQSSRLTITLPPGAATDTSNCNLTFTTRVGPSDSPEIDIQKPFDYSVTGTPAFMSLNSGTNRAGGATGFAPIAFTGNVANIRGTTAVRTATLTAATPNNRTDTLTVVINPPPTANAFTQAAQCRNAVTGTTINVNDTFQCELRLSQTPPTAGQLITFEVIDRLCVDGGADTVTYRNTTGIGTFTAPNTGTIHQVPLRALGGSTSVGTPCADLVSPVAHLLKFWIGQRDTESGTAFTQTQIRIRAPQ